MIRAALKLLLPYLVAAFAGGGLVGVVMHAQLRAEQAERQAEVANLRAGSSDERAARADEAIEQLGQLTEAVRQSVRAGEKQREEAHAFATQTRSALDGLRSDTGGLQRHLAGMPQQFGSLARSTVERYASTCTGLLEGLAAGGERLAEKGAGIAAAAQGHYIDDAVKARAWPAPSPAP